MKIIEVRVVQAVQIGTETFVVLRAEGKPPLKLEAGPLGVTVAHPKGELLVPWANIRACYGPPAGAKP